MTPDKENRPTRRIFIQSAAGMTALAATSGYQRSYAEDAPLRIGIVGTGSRGVDLLRHLATIDAASVTAICDNYPPHLEYAKEIAGERAETFTRFDRMLARGAFDALIVATPLTDHYAMCVAAIERGLPVFCEKMMCYSIDEAKRLAELVEHNDAIFQVGLQRRSNAIYDQAEAMVRAGMLGTVTTIKAQWHRNSDWRRRLPVKPGHPDHAALERKLNWRLYRDTSQGLMAELGSHQLDVVNRLLGVAPLRVMGMGGVDYWRDGREIDDTVLCTFEYQVPDAASGKSQTVRVSYSSIETNAFEGVSELIMGTKGTLLLTQQKALFYVEGADTVPTVSDQSEIDGLSGATLRLSNDPWAHRGRPSEIDSDLDDTRAHLLSFIRDAQSGNRDTACGARIGLENTATIITANEAIRTGNAVPFPEDCRQNRAQA